jgi:hypothetical protein
MSWKKIGSFGRDQWPVLLLVGCVVVYFAIRPLVDAAQTQPSSHSQVEQKVPFVDPLPPIPSLPVRGYITKIGRHLEEFEVDGRPVSKTVVLMRLDSEDDICYWAVVDGDRKAKQTLDFAERGDRLEIRYQRGEDNYRQVETIKLTKPGD